MPEAGCIARLVGIDMRESGRKRFDRLMIEHDHIKAGIARRVSASVAAAPQSTVMTRLAPSSFSSSIARGVRAIAFRHAIGNVDARAASPTPSENR